MLQNTSVYIIYQRVLQHVCVENFCFFEYSVTGNILYVERIFAGICTTYSWQPKCCAHEFPWKKRHILATSLHWFYLNFTFLFLFNLFFSLFLLSKHEHTIPCCQHTGRLSSTSSSQWFTGVASCAWQGQIPQRRPAVCAKGEFVRLVNVAEKSVQFAVAATFYDTNGDVLFKWSLKEKCQVGGFISLLFPFLCKASLLFYLVKPETSFLVFLFSLLASISSLFFFLN